MTSPISRLRRLLDGPSRWHALEHHQEVGSTNDLALAALADGVPPGLVVVADRQTAGRGRRGRVWQDRPAGASLAVSVTLAPADEHRSLVPLLAGVALADALATLRVGVRLKWPNDVVVDDPADGGVVDGPADGGAAKLAGILAEARDDGVVLGTGVNVDFRGAPPIEGATSVAEVTAGEVDRWAVLVAYLDALDRRLTELDDEGREPLLAAYRERCSTLGNDVVAELPRGTVRGHATAISSTGALVVDAGRELVEVTSGDVVHLRRRA